ncbi:MAG: protease SohB [Gammaproteobacteria bacterium]|nr:protease SohB [Gammaproteobacteria bacterium]MDH4253131.1 protease SohB [Gammaproteobacteria bacterium]MDH5308958.1 protease SohB [Gammaproteobacteria bacterium]
MSEFFAEYGLFLLKTVTLAAAIVFVIGSAAAASRKAAQQEGLEVENLNEKYKALSKGLRKAIMKKDERKAEAKAEKQRAKQEAKSKEHKPRGFVIDFKGDLKATGVQSLREEISAILEVADDRDQVIVRLDNHGGVVHEHGLAASQLIRVRRRGIPLTVIVDKVAASGGYLMACVANRIYAAPFAILGSIGVIAQIPNFNRMLDTHGVEFEMVTAGEFKRTVTMFGKNTEKERAKLKEQLEDVHSLFKAAVQEYRPQLDLDRVATGEYWYGSMALELNLVDELKTSDELLAELAKDHDLFHVAYKVKQPLQKRLMSSVDGAVEKLDAAGWRRRFESGLPR